MEVVLRTIQDGGEVVVRGDTAPMDMKAGGGGYENAAL